MSIISNKLKLALFLLLFSSLSFGQGLYINGTSSATGASVSANSNNGAIDTFMLQYYTTGTPATLSIQIEGDNGSGSFVICGSAVTTVTSGQTKCVGNYKLVRYNLTTLTGGSSPTVTATLVGNTSGDEPTGIAAAQVQGSVASGTAIASAGFPVLIACSTNGGSAGASQIFNVACGTNGSILTLIQQTPSDGVSNASLGGAYSNPGGAGLYPIILPYILDGTGAWGRTFNCTQKAKLNALAAATTQIVALSGATKIRICSALISNNNATATTLKFVEGTGANCATGQTDVTALMNIGATSTAPIVIPWGSAAAPVTTTGGDALCFTSSAASSLEITITFAQY